MSDPVPVRGVVLAHGAMAKGLVDAARQISGIDSDALVPISNTGATPQELLERVRSAAGSGPVLIFTDLPSGSCAFAARKLTRELPNAVVLTGVNLPVLIDFVLHREMPLDALVPRLLEKAHAGVRCTPAELEDHARRAVSRG